MDNMVFKSLLSLLIQWRSELTGNQMLNFQIHIAKEVTIFHSAN